MTRCVQRQRPIDGRREGMSSPLARRHPYCSPCRMAKQTNNPAPHAGEKEARAIPKSGQTPGMGAPPMEGQEPGTREDGEALPPESIDRRPDGKDAKPNRDATGF